jgi:hypothetical protein
MIHKTIELPIEQIADFCQQWRIKEFALFGSILRDDFRPDSDIDVLVTFEANTRWTLMDHVRMELELSEILGRKIDLIEQVVIEQSHNWIRRKEILSTARTFYVKR